jgi:lantibiotic modifying enzyme
MQNARYPASWVVQIAENFALFPHRISGKRAHSKPIQEAVTAEPAQNKVLFNGIEQHIEEHLQQIIEGFSDFHGLIVSRKQSFIQFLSSFNSSRSRVIFRSTSVYSKLIKESTHPDALRSGLRRSLGEPSRLA